MLRLETKTKDIKTIISVFSLDLNLIKSEILLGTSKN